MSSPVSGYGNTPSSTSALFTADEDHGARPHSWRDFFPEIIGCCPSLQVALETSGKVAKTLSPTLILGESGTGKELIASAIHRLSPRSSARFVAINCSAIPEDLLEAELFGYEKGAFTGADRRRNGLFDAANGGTLFLDEIGEMPLRLQAKLLRVLQEKRYSPLGSDEVKVADARIVAATNANLEKAIAEKSFRLDLFYRLNVVPITLPALRERGSDIDLLIDHFLEMSNRLYCQEHPCVLSHTAREMLRNFSWPGNVRELRNVIERMVILATGGLLGMEHVPPEVRGTRAAELIPVPPTQPTSLPIAPQEAVTSSALAPYGEEGRIELPRKGLNLATFIADLENDLIIQALRRTGNNKNQAARLLGLNRTTLVERIKKRKLTVDGSQYEAG